jgi:predicted DNA-binding transcriptional regulator AlpA
MTHDPSNAIQGAKRWRCSNPQPLRAAQIPEALLTMRNAATISGLSVATCYRKSATDATFPKLVKMGKRCTRIRAGELTAWLDAQGSK